MALLVVFRSMWYAGALATEATEGVWSLPGEKRGDVEIKDRAEC